MKRETKEPAVLDGNQWNIAKVAILEFWGPRVKSQRGVIKDLVQQLATLRIKNVD
jgi:hypothetical protein